MPARIVFLGSLRELAGRDWMELDAPLRYDALLAALPEPVTAQVEGGRVHIACRGEVLAEPALLDAQDGDEVALLPPVSGG